MRTTLSLFLGMILACQGCSPLAHVFNTIVYEPTDYPRRFDDLVEQCRNKELAEAAWKELQVHEPEHVYSRYFQSGFISGYADYLYAGGNGNPPPVPPRRAWRAEYETPEGHQEIEEWFAGFRRGAAEARASGKREVVTLPFSTPPIGQSPAPTPSIAPLAPAPALEKRRPVIPVPPANQVLPAPRVVPPESGKDGGR